MVSSGRLEASVKELLHARILQSALQRHGVVQVAVFGTLFSAETTRLVISHSGQGRSDSPVGQVDSWALGALFFGLCSQQGGVVHLLGVLRRVPASSVLVKAKLNELAESAIISCHESAVLVDLLIAYSFFISIFSTVLNFLTVIS